MNANMRIVAVTLAVTAAGLEIVAVFLGGPIYRWQMVLWPALTAVWACNWFAAGRRS